MDRKRDESQVSYDIMNLYPSVPINKALDVLIDQLNNSKDDKKSCTLFKRYL